MGDTFHDPVDHLRTTRPLAGESLIDVMHWPGYLLGGRGRDRGLREPCGLRQRTPPRGHDRGRTGVIAAVLGLVWLAVEHRRIRRIADRWYAEHPEVYRQWPAS